MLLGGMNPPHARGNNNAYCRTTTSWHDWNRLEQHQGDIFRFTRGLIAFRRRTQSSHQRFYTNAEIHWSAPHGDTCPNGLTRKTTRLACLITKAAQRAIPDVQCQR